MSRGSLYPVFQPIVSLDSGGTVGYEALIRGPSGSAFATPDKLFREGARAGRLAELDWICRAASCRAALMAGLPTTVPLFLNAEPATFRTPPPAQLIDTFRAASDQLQVVVEITERKLGSDPGGLLAAVLRLREAGMRIALDDVGATTTSLAMMPLISPDVIKIDRGVVQGPITPAASAVVNAVLAEAERTGAAVLAEGIESPRHLAVARAMGATLGQGWLFGRPEPLPHDIAAAEFVLPRVPAPELPEGTPYEIASRHRATARTTKEVLRCLSRHLENKCLDLTEPAVLLAAFQQARHFDDAVRTRYTELAGRGVLTAVYAAGLNAEPVVGIRGGPLDSADPMTREWIVVVLGAHFAAGLFAYDQGRDDDDEDSRAFDYVLTYDRRLVTAAAQPLLRRLLPTEPETFW